MLAKFAGRSNGIAGITPECVIREGDVSRGNPQADRRGRGHLGARARRRRRQRGAGAAGEQSRQDRRLVPDSDRDRARASDRRRTRRDELAMPPTRAMEMSRRHVLHASAAVATLAAGARCCARAILSDAADHDDRAVPGRRRDRHAGAFSLRAAARHSRPAHHHRERRRCGRQHRRRARRARRGRRLYAEHRHADDPRADRRPLSAGSSISSPISSRSRSSPPSRC